MNTKKILAGLSLSSILLLTACSSTNDPQKPNLSTVGVSSGSPESTPQSAANSAQSLPGTESTSNVSSGGQNNSESTVSEPETSFTPPNNDQQGEVSGSILVLPGGRGIMLYGIGYGPGRNYAETVNKYKEKLGANVNVYSMVVPTQLSFYLPEKYFDEGVSDRELPHIDDINEHLYGIIPIDAFSALKDHVGEDIYYRTDHHWTQLGAYYAAKAFAETALVPFDDLSAYEKHEKEGYLGSFYGGSGEHPEIKNNPEKFMWFIPKREVTTVYYDQKGENGYEGSYFFKPEDFNVPSQWLFTYMSGDGNIVHVSTGLDTGRKLMILKDSYADSFAPCLFGSFDEIWIADIRFCEIGAVGFAKDKGITDLLFCCSAYSAAGDSRYKLYDIQRKLEEIM